MYGVGDDGGMRISPWLRGLVLSGPENAGYADRINSDTGSNRRPDQQTYLIASLRRSADAYECQAILFERQGRIDRSERHRTAAAE